LKPKIHETVFNILVERDEDSYYVASVVELPGCHTQAKTLDQLSPRIREAIEAYLQVAEPEHGPEFVGVQHLKIDWKALAPEAHKGQEGCKGVNQAGFTLE